MSTRRIPPLVAGLLVMGLSTYYLFRSATDYDLSIWVSMGLPFATFLLGGALCVFGATLLPSPVKAGTVVRHEKRKLHPLSRHGQWGYVLRDNNGNEAWFDSSYWDLLDYKPVGKFIGREKDAYSSASRYWVVVGILTAVVVICLVVAYHLGWLENLSHALHLNYHCVKLDCKPS